MLILFSSFSFFPLGSGEGRIIDRQAKAGKRCFFFRFFLAGVGFTKSTVLRVSPGKLRIGIWWVVGSVRTRARFNLSLILVL